MAILNTESDSKIITKQWGGVGDRRVIRKTGDVQEVPRMGFSKQLGKSQMSYTACLVAWYINFSFLPIQVAIEIWQSIQLSSFINGASDTLPSPLHLRACVVTTPGSWNIYFGSFCGLDFCEPHPYIILLGPALGQIAALSLL